MEYEKFERRVKVSLAIGLIFGTIALCSYSFAFIGLVLKWIYG